VGAAMCDDSDYANWLNSQFTVMIQLVYGYAIRMFMNNDARAESALSTTIAFILNMDSDPSGNNYPKKLKTYCKNAARHIVTLQYQGMATGCNSEDKLIELSNPHIKSIQKKLLHGDKSGIRADLKIFHGILKIAGLRCYQNAIQTIMLTIDEHLTDKQITKLCNIVLDAMAEGGHIDAYLALVKTGKFNRHYKQERLVINAVRAGHYNAIDRHEDTIVSTVNMKNNYKADWLYQGFFCSKDIAAFKRFFDDKTSFNFWNLDLRAGRGLAFDKASSRLTNYYLATNSAQYLRFMSVLYNDMSYFYKPKMIHFMGYMIEASANCLHRSHFLHTVSFLHPVFLNELIEKGFANNRPPEVCALVKTAREIGKFMLKYDINFDQAIEYNDNLHLQHYLRVTMFRQLIPGLTKDVCNYLALFVTTLSNDDFIDLLAKYRYVNQRNFFIADINNNIGIVHQGSLRKELNTKVHSLHELHTFFAGKKAEYAQKGNTKLEAFMDRHSRRVN
jgi:hypothetical protein